MEVYVLLAVVVFFILFVLSGITVIRQSETMVIERLGKFHRLLQSGVNVLVPVLDRPRDIMWVSVTENTHGGRVVLKYRLKRIDLRETVYDFPRQSVITKDNVVTEINALLYFQITDPMRAVYEIANLPDALEKLTQTTLRNVIGEMDLDQTLSSRDEVNSKLRAILDEASDKWGVKVNRVELQEIIPPHDIREALEKQMRAERQRRASVLEAEGKKRAAILEAEGEREAQINQADGEKQSTVLRAQGDAEAKILAAQAEAQAIAKISEAIRGSQSDPAAYLIAVKYLETLRQIADGNKNRVVFLPYEATAALGSLGGIRELLKEETTPYPPTAPRLPKE